MNLLEIEENQSKIFNTVFLNNVRALILVFDKLLPKEYFIKLPGDEIVEHKHPNIKILTAMMNDSNLSRKPTKKWIGLGANPFTVDYARMFDNYKQFSSDVEQPKQVTPAEAKQEKAPPAGKGAAAKQEILSDVAQICQVNQLEVEVEIKNTEFHKSIMKARNENFTVFRTRFDNSIARIMKTYDEFRREEHAFTKYWSENLKEITIKHI